MRYLICFLLFPITLWASEECGSRPNVLFLDCDGSSRVALIEPSDFDAEASYELAVTGTYSSGDRIGIEGLAVVKGKVLSRRLQGWDGVLILDQAGHPHVFNARNVLFGREAFNIKDSEQAQALLSAVAQSGASMVQSHLLISEGVLDLRDVANAPVFYRRLFYVLHDGEFGVWQPPQRLTLYDAAVQLQDELQPRMALNLDMGAYDFCLRKGAQDCGRLAISFDRLTNILVFQAQPEDES